MNTDYSFTSVWGLNYEFMEEDSLVSVSGIFVLLLLGSVAFLVGTTTGLHLLFNAANRWVPGLEIGQVTGGWRDLTLKGVKYQMPGVSGERRAVPSGAQPGLPAISTPRCASSDLSLQDVSVVVDSKKMTPASAPPPRRGERPAESLHAVPDRALSGGAG